MSLPYFFVEKKNIHNNTIRIVDKVDIKHIKVLRLNRNDKITILDNEGGIYKAVIEQVKEEEIKCKITSKEEGQETHIVINLMQSLLKQSKLEYVLLYTTPLYIKNFIPVVAAHSIKNKITAPRMERLKKLAKESAQRAKRLTIPIIHEPLKFEDAIKINQLNQSHSLRIILYEKSPNNFKNLLKKELNQNIKNIYLLVGPEGSFSEEEIKKAEEVSWQTATLGNIIFKAEAAAIIALSMMLYELNILG